MIFFLLTSTLCVIYIAFRKRYFDVFTIVTFVSLYYSTPLYVGVLYDPSSHEVIAVTPLLYFFYTVYFCSLLLAAWRFDRAGNLSFLSFPENCHYYKSYLSILTALSVVFFLSLLALDPVFFLPNTVDDAKVAHFGVLYPLFCWSTLLALVFSFASNERSYQIFLIFLITLTLTAGSRAYFAYAIAIILFFVGGSAGHIRLATNVKMLGACFFGFLFLFFYKIAYPFVLNADYSGMIAAISDSSNIGFRLFKGSESFLIMLNLHYSIEAGWSLNGDYVFVFLLRLIPFFSRYLSDVVGVEIYRYSDLLKELHYSDVGYGMASSAWGQTFYLVGYAAFLCPILFFTLVYVGNKSIMSGRRDFLFLLPTMVALSVSFSRMEISDPIYVLAISTIVYLIVRLSYQCLRS